MSILLLLAGLVLLTLGAEILVRGATALALAMRISPLVVGLTIVAFGTSAPELVVSLQASLRGQPDIALGNVIGSNIFNVLFILGLSAMIVPLVVAQQLVRFDVPLMIGLSVALWVMAVDGNLGRLDGLLLSTGLLAYTIWAVVQSRKEQTAIEQEYAAEFGRPSPLAPAKVAWHIASVAAGLGLLIGGSRLFSDAAVTMARHWGVSELVIGITIVATGTSLPEVATSLLAAVRGERDIAVGNVVGSNIFNILGVLGLAGSLAPAGIAVPPTAIQVDIPVMAAVALACLPIFLTGHRIARWEGALFFGYYLAYTTWLILSATAAPLTRTYGAAMLWIVLPLTVVTLIVAVTRSGRSRRSSSSHGGQDAADR